MSNTMERALLSCCLQDSAVVGQEILSTFQDANPFSDDVCWRVYNAWRATNSKVLDIPSMAEKLNSRATFDADWWSEIRAIVNQVPSPANWREYFSAVKDSFIKRCANKELELALHGLSETDNVTTYLQDVSKKLVTIDTFSEVDEVDIGNEVQNEVDRLERGEAYSTGVPAVDNIIGPLEPGEVLTIAALTGVGKSLLAANIVRYLSVQQGIPGVYFSFEMNPAKHVARIAASMTHQNSKNIVRLYSEGNQEAIDAYNKVMASPISWDKRPRLSPSQIVNKIKRLSTTKGIKYAIIDTLDFVKLDSRMRKNEAIGEFIKDFKAVCTDEGVIPILLVQINRSAKESEKGIGLQHLKDSSAIEQDSSQVLILDRETTLTDEEESRVLRGEPITLKAAGAKSRYDMTGYRQLALFLHSSLIQDRAYNDEEVPQ